MYHFDSDYMEGAHPAILERLTAINFDKHDGYGCDSICDSARARIREACGAPGAEVHLLTGGTLELTMGHRPCLTWAVAEDSVPPSEGSDMRPMSGR